MKTKGRGLDDTTREEGRGRGGRLGQHLGALMLKGQAGKEVWVWGLKGSNQKETRTTLVFIHCSCSCKNTPQGIRVSWDRHHHLPHQLINDVDIPTFFSLVLE